MGEVNGDFDGRLNVAGEEDGDDERVHEWEVGLPNADDITPLTQGLIPLELLSAFNIKPQPYRTSEEVRQASEDTLCLLRGTNFKVFGEENDDESETKKQRRNDSPEDADSVAEEEVAADVTTEADAGGGFGGGGSGGGGGEKTVKRSRLVWTPQLHKRFVDVVGHLGIKNAVPKTIMQLMNVEGLTRENVASHLQKYRLYLKRMQGGSFDGGTNSSSENGNWTGNGNGNGNGSGNGGMSASVPVMPKMGMDTGMMRMGNLNGFEGHHNHNQQHSNNHYNYLQYSNGNGMMMQPGNKYSSFVSYHHPRHVGSGDN